LLTHLQSYSLKEKFHCQLFFATNHCQLTSTMHRPTDVPEAVLRKQRPTTCRSGRTTNSYSLPVVCCAKRNMKRKEGPLPGCQRHPLCSHLFAFCLLPFAFCLHLSVIPLSLRLLSLCHHLALSSGLPNPLSPSFLHPLSPLRPTSLKGRIVLRSVQLRKTGKSPGRWNHVANHDFNFYRQKPANGRLCCPPVARRQSAYSLSDSPTRLHQNA